MMQRPARYTRAMGDAVVNIFKVLANLDITEKRKPQDGSFSGPPTAGDERSSISRFPRRHRRQRRRREDGHAHPRRARRVADLSQRRHARQDADASPRRHHPAARHVPRLRPDRLRQEHHPLRLPATRSTASRRTSSPSRTPSSITSPNVTQIEVNPKAGKTFASELRSILRQDPDVILIGEIRDKETAEIACQAAQTGHMVFTTLHANDTVTAIGRLIDLGVQPFMLSNALSAVLGQRLVRLLCPKCKQRYKPDPEMLRKANLPVDKIKFFTVRPGTAADDELKFCEHCSGTGYRGRNGVFELLVAHRQDPEMIRENPNLARHSPGGDQERHEALQEDGLRQVIEGETSIQELLRVCK